MAAYSPPGAVDVVPLMWYWVEANVRRHCEQKRGELGLRRGDGSGQFGFAGKFLRVSLGRTAVSLKTNGFEEVRPKTIERITVL